jgi:DNA integrity scanning protein DisA with diadenylate cyclase activity
MDPPPSRVGYDVYQQTRRPEIAALDEAIVEISQLFAGLADVDGAVVITDQLELLGFGAEIIGVPDVATVRHAQDLEATEYHIDGTDRVGTRHRNAYRLCAFEPACLAIVVSQDGGVQFVKSLNGHVTVWDHGQALL